MQRKYSVIVICVCFLLCGFILCVVLNQSKTKSVIGTFCTNEGILQDDIYVSIYSDDSFLIYKQFDVISYGTYSIDDYQHFSVITFKEKDGNQTIAVYDNRNVLIFIGKLGEYILGTKDLKRISMIPMEINVTDVSSAE